MLDYLDPEEHTPSSKNVPDLAGHVGFLAAYPVQVPITDLPIRCPHPGALELDVVTCHHSKYYSGATAIAFDDDEPNPVIFPAVAPGHVFAFVIVPLRGNHRSFSQPGKLLQTLARDWLAGGLNTFGLGAKTAAGYGWFAISPEIGAAVENQRQVRAAAEQEQRKAQADRERQRREEEKKRLDREAMRQYFMDRHRLPCWRAGDNVSAEGILHMQFALLLQDQDRHSGKLLGGGTEVKLGLRCIGYLLIPVSHAITLTQKYVTIVSNQDRTAELLMSNHVCEQVICFRGHKCILRSKNLLHSRDRQRHANILMSSK